MNEASGLLWHWGPLKGSSPICTGTWKDWGGTTLWTSNLYIRTTKAVSHWLAHLKQRRLSFILFIRPQTFLYLICVLTFPCRKTFIQNICSSTRRGTVKSSSYDRYQKLPFFTFLTCSCPDLSLTSRLLLLGDHSFKIACWCHFYTCRNLLYPNVL